MKIKIINTKTKVAACRCIISQRKERKKKKKEKRKKKKKRRVTQNLPLTAI